MNEHAGVPVQALERCFVTLEELKGSGSVGVTELSERTGQPKSTVYNHLRTLRELGYVVQDGEKYRLGLRFLDLGHSTRRTLEIYEVGKPEVDKLAAETGDLANLMVEEDGRGVYLYHGKGGKAIKLDTYAGTRVPLHATALGKAMLAEFSEERVQAIVDRHGLEPVTANTITDEKELFESLADVRERGYALDRGEHHEEIRSVAAPVTDRKGTVEGAVSISAPASRMKGDRFHTEVPNMVTNAANLIEINITYP